VKTVDDEVSFCAATRELFLRTGAPLRASPVLPW
jgi:hypothetical protein